TGFAFSGSINSIHHGGGGAEATPSIVIHNTYSPGPGGLPGFTRAPAIELIGDITNLDGSLSVTNDQGSIISSGTILVATANFFAPNGAFVQSYVDSLQHFGDAPYTLWDLVALKARDPGNPAVAAFTIDQLIAQAKSADNDGGSSWIFGDDVSISARYLNINGVIQSGLPDQVVTIDPGDVGATGKTVTQQIAAAEAAASQY